VNNDIQSMHHANISQAVGVAVSGTIFQNCLKVMALSRPSLASYADEYSRNAAELGRIIKTIPNGEMQEDAKQVYADALKIVWGVMCGVSMIGLAVTIFTKEYSLDAPDKTIDDNSGDAGDEKC
jgi:hypothetical protein